MRCSAGTRIGLFVLYVASIVSALANPASLNFEDAYLLTQGANVTTLLLLAYCKRGTAEAFLAAVLGVAFTMRATGKWKGGSRWDSLLVTVGMLIILQDAFKLMLPRGIPHRTLLYLGFSCMVLPVLSALPHLLKQPDAQVDVLRKAADFCGQAYVIPKDKTNLPGSAWTLYDPKTDTSAGVSRDGNDIYVFFRGSESTTDWKTNVNILGDAVPAEWECPGEGPPLRTHRGYTEAFKSVATDMLASVDDLATPGSNPRIIFCGHSLGGALATMAAMFVACKRPHLRPNIVMVTFGAPQVGDGNFVAGFNEIIPSAVRVVNPMDPVPRLLSVQLVHVKGYYPVGTFDLDNIFKAHSLSMYVNAMGKARALSIIASFWPAVVVALLIGSYVLWQLGRMA